MKQMYLHGGKAYIILRRVLESRFSYKLGNEPNMEHIQMYRDWVGADHVLRDQTHFLFCETIQDIEFEEL
jgi:hypothetical protein